MGAVARATEIAHIDGALPLVVFLISAPLAVIGIPQLLDARAEARRREVPALIRPGDLRHFYLPVWGRMFVFFASCVATVLTMKAAGV